MRFSQRIGIQPVETVVQTNGMTIDLRNSLWNVLNKHLWSLHGFMTPSNAEVYRFGESLWQDYFKEPTDNIPVYGEEILRVVRDYFFKAEWHIVYDFLEFTLRRYGRNTNLIEATNNVLARELSGYRFVDSCFIPVTDESEIESLNAALSDSPFERARTHLQSALGHLARKENPDYRNSMKESISAVESLVRELTGNPKAKLGEALKLLEKDKLLHPALKTSYSSLYGYTNDSDGIRHALNDEPNLTVAEAKFFLVSCASFINYLKVKIPYDSES